MVKNIFLILIFVHIFSACGGGGGGENSGNNSSPLAADSVDYIRYPLKNSSLVEVSYPSGWSIKSNPEDDLIRAFLSPLENQSDRVRDGVFYFKFNLDELIEDEEYVDINIISERVSSISGFDSIEYVFEARLSEENITMKFLAHEVLLNGDTYVIAYAAEKSSFSKYELIGRHVLNSTTIGIELENVNLYDSSDPAGKIAVASDGDNFLTVSCRVTERSEPFGTGTRDYKYMHIYGVLSTSDGEVIKSFNISPEFDTKGTRFPCGEQHPDVFFGGDMFLVVYGMSNYPNSFQHGLYANRINRAGDLYDNTPILLSSRVTIDYTHPGPETLYAVGRRPDISFNGEEFLVTWKQFSYSSDDTDEPVDGIFATAVPQFDAVGAPFLIHEQQNAAGSILFQDSFPKVTYFNSMYHIVWSELGDFSDPASGIVYGLRLDSIGNKVDSTPLFLLGTGSDVTSVDIASTSDGIVMGWHGDIDDATSQEKFTISRFSDFSELQSGNYYIETLWDPMPNIDRGILVGRNHGVDVYYIKDNEGLYMRSLNDGSLIEAEEFISEVNYMDSYTLFNIGVGFNDDFLVHMYGNTLSGWLINTLQ